jgi:exodeoxyribonuclease-3
MKLVSWNVNGIRSAVSKGLGAFLEKEPPDVLAVQETKLHEALESEKLDSLGYTQYINPAEKKGYSGTSIFTRAEPISVSNGIGDRRFDSEGRVQTAEFREFFLLNCYFPNAQRDLARLDYKLEFDAKFLDFAKGLDRKKPLVICGDFNVAHQEIDIARPRENRGNAGFTDQERKWMDRLLAEGFFDSFRKLHSDTVKYSWWSYIANARRRNIGWRIDYFVVSDRLMPKVLGSDILTEVRGSDHAPIVLTIN